MVFLRFDSLAVNMSENVGYRNRDILSELYHDHGLSIRQIAHQYDVSRTCIHTWMKRLDIERRDSPNDKPPHFRINASGYPEIMHKTDGPDGYRNYQVPIHRINATLLDCVDDLSDLDGMNVHHDDCCKRNSGRNNLKVMTPSEHSKHHGEETREIDTRLVEALTAASIGEVADPSASGEVA